MDVDEVYIELGHIEYMALVREYWDVINDVKGHLQNGEHDLAKVVFADIPEADRIKLWRATTKGGVWTVEERGWLR